MSHIKSRYSSYVLLAGIHSAMIPISIAEAKPWLDAGDMQFRHHLQILADANLLDAPIATSLGFSRSF